MNEIFKRFRPIFYIILAFLAGCLFAGLCLNRPGFGSIGKFDERYYSEQRRAAETIGKLETELARERELNRELREHNKRARELTEELAGTSGRNVRNLQEAVGVVGEIRTKLKVLEEFYANRDTISNNN